MTTAALSFQCGALAVALDCSSRKMCRFLSVGQLDEPSADVQRVVRLFCAGFRQRTMQGTAQPVEGGRRRWDWRVGGISV
jgi:hypothetical protein